MLSRWRRMRSVSPRQHQVGLSLVELLVGVAVGLFVVAGATALVGSQLGDNRRLIVETQLQQDLRAAADIISRDLRRAGHWADSSNFVLALGAGSAGKNPYSVITPSVSGTTSDSTTYSYRRGPGQTGPYGFRLTGTVIQTQLAGAGWTDLTDSRVLEVTSFEVTPRNIVGEQLPCPKLCADGTTSCWPRVTVRELELLIQARAKTDQTVRRTIRSTVRLRNDWVEFRDAANPDDLCPD